MQKTASISAGGTVGDKWYASSVYGAVTKDTEVSLKDDYFTAVNQDQIVGLTMDDGFSSAGVFRDADKIMRDRTLALLRDTEPVQSGSKLCRRLMISQPISRMAVMHCAPR